MTSNKSLTIAIVAGEHSGDLLGAGLMRAIKSQSSVPVRFVGVGGPLMAEQGLASFFPMDDLAVMGIAEVLAHLPKLLRHRKNLVNYLVEQKPDVMIGIDAPDFNLTVERRLKQKGIATVHYVSPSVWAWRKGRIKGIKKSVDHMLCLLPFEKQFYDQHQLPATFVGHPLADQIPMQWSCKSARDELNIQLESPMLALLPGSRTGEIERMGPLFLAVAARLHQQHANLQFIAPMISDARAEQFRAMHQQLAADLPLTITVGNSRETMAAADYLLLTSGTVALEAMLIKRPMVVAYRFSAVTYWLIKRLFHAPFFSLPNLLAGKKLVPELAQDEATEEALTEQLQALMQSSNESLISTFTDLHRQLKVNASDIAADAILSLVNSKNSNQKA